MAADIPISEKALLRSVRHPGLMHERRLGSHGRFGIDDGWQRLILDGDQVQGLLGELRRPRRYSGDRLAMVTHTIRRQKRLIPNHARHQQPSRQVLRGEHGFDALKRPRPAGIHRADQGMRMWASQDRSIQLAG